MHNTEMDLDINNYEFEDILNLLLVSNITDNIIVNHVDIKTRRIYNLFLHNIEIFHNNLFKTI